MISLANRRLSAAICAIGVAVPLLVAAAPTSADHSRSWEQYVLAPDSEDVAPERVLGSANVRNPHGLLKPGHGSATLNRELTGGSDSWPSGTTAKASSSKNADHEASAAIDGDVETAWTDATPGEHPDTLTITAPEPVRLPGITLESTTDGYPSDYAVETWNGSRWVKQATVEGRDVLTQPVAFTKPVTTTRVRVTIAGNWFDPNFPLNHQSISRITELLPGLVGEAFVDLDFGTVVAGRLEIGFTGASNPAPGVRVATSETKAALGARSDYSHSDYGPDENAGGDDQGPGTSNVVPATDGGVWVDAKACQFGDDVCSDGIRAFRYARVYLGSAQGDSAHAARYGRVDIDYLRLNFTSHLGTSDTYEGYFLSSDDTLNKAWYASTYTAELNTTVFEMDDADPRGCQSETLQGKWVYLDGPKRDRCTYGGGMDVAFIADYLAHPNPEKPMANTLGDFADHQKDNGDIPGSAILDYSLYTERDYWVRELFVYVLYTGDLEFAREYWPHTVRLLNDHYPDVLDENGTVRGDGYESILYVQQLRQAMVLGEWLAEEYGASYASHNDDWATRADDAAVATDEQFWDADPGAYKGSTTAQPSEGRCHPTYANAIASAGMFGAAPNLSPSITSESNVSSILDHLATYKNPWGYGGSDDGDACPFLGINTEQLVYGQANAYLANAAFQNGKPSLGYDVLRTTYGWQLDRDPGTLWEGYGPGGSTETFWGLYFTSMAHGHMAGAAAVLTNHVLGVAPSGLGFETVDIAPKPGDLRFAEGRVPTPYGPIDVSWKASGKFRMTVTVPDGVTARVILPDGEVIEGVTSGTHSF